MHYRFEDEVAEADRKVMCESLQETDFDLSVRLARIGYLGCQLRPRITLAYGLYEDRGLEGLSAGESAAVRMLRSAGEAKAFYDEDDAIYLLDNMPPDMRKVADAVRKVLATVGPDVYSGDHRDKLQRLCDMTCSELLYPTSL